MSERNRPSILKKESTRTVVASLLSILIGLLAGGLIIFIVSLFNSDISLKDAWEGIRLILFGLFSTGRNAAGNLTFGYNPVSIGNMLFRATPVILTGLSVAIAYKTGLFNIGAPGQYLVGTAVTLYIALSIPTSTLPVFLIWIIAFIGGMLAGALWGSIPGTLKAYLNINEVLACIMTNWIAANLVTWLFDGSSLKNVLENTKSGYIYKTSYLLEDRLIDGVMTTTNAGATEGELIATRGGIATSKMGLDSLFSGSQVNGGIIIAILLAILVYILISKTVFGYELKACGANRHAAKYAGIADKRNIILSMAIAGSLAGGAGALYALSGNTEFFWNTAQSLPSVGFNGIPVALLAANNPIAVIFTGMFMSMLDICGQRLTELTGYNEFITDVIIAVIVYLSAFSLVIKMWLGRRRSKSSDKSSFLSKTTAAAPSDDKPAKEAVRE